jgi:hypothetical protein
MSLILARSPYFIERGTYDEDSILTLSIGRGSAAVIGMNPLDFVYSATKTYTINYRQRTRIDISPLIRDYISYNGVDEYVVYVKATKSGTISGSPSSTTSYFFATDGYGYYEDGYNPSLSTELSSRSYYAGSNTTIYRLDDKAINIPFLSYEKTFAFVPNSVNYSIYESGSLISSGTITFNVDSGSENAYKTFSTVIDPQKRIEADGGTFVASKCYDKFLRNTKLDSYDTIILGGTTLNIKSISECKHTPYEIRFKNRYGVEESLWFFKRSDQSIKREKESYRANTIDAYANDDLYLHTYKDYNVNARESLVLNTGFLEESFSENFRQLMLSESVYVMIDDVKLPVNIKNDELTYKKSVNEKLINYNIEIEFSYDKLNNIV